ncbi:hypothetical protein WA026_004700, partial [Henosepilachna vigintioctopunctata]
MLLNFGNSNKCDATVLVTLNEFNEQFDVVILTETRNDFDMDLFQLEGSEIVNIGPNKAIELEIDTEDGRLKILSMNRPPSTRALDFVEELHGYSVKSRSSYNTQIIIGYINILKYDDLIT